MNNPLGVFVSDSVWIAYTYNISLKQFKYDGSLIRVIYHPPEHKGALINPTDLVVHQDNIYVVDSGANSLVVFKKDGEFVTRIGNNGTLSSPHSVAAHEDVLAISDTGNDRVSVYDLSGKLLRVIGSFGAQPGKFNEPLGVAFDDFGRLYVVDSNNNRVQKFEKDGTNIGAWGDYGSSSGTFAQPVGVGVVDGKVYVADTLNHRMQAFELDGTYAFQFGRHPVNGHEGVGRTHYPYRIAGLKHSSILATVEPNENRVQIYDLNKVSELKSVDDDAWWGKGTKFHYGRRMIANASFVGISEPDTHAVLLFEQGKETDAPTFLTLLGGRGSRGGEFIQPSGLALKPDGSKLFVSDSGNRRLQTFTISEPTNLVQFGGPTGGPQSPPEVPQVTLAEVVSLDGDQLQSQIKRFSAPGQSSSFSPSGMRVGPDGRLYVIDPYNGRVAVLNESYEIIRTIGRNATIDETILRFPLDCWFPRGTEPVFPPRSEPPLSMVF
ncbi:NHL repeat-containing protein [Neorhizobium galegae]|uniref:NHL repeat-containing protein n=1 Tax=Neorhizobium galegae TaxID=399 RepID=UPI002102C8C0|nr:NHL repeat-containing protein [Neorhizobium galegae]MCQ1856102.1 NHL repeat-containing protein [Neorhizobium galegae]